MIPNLLHLSDIKPGMFKREALPRRFNNDSYCYFCHAELYSHTGWRYSPLTERAKKLIAPALDWMFACKTCKGLIDDALSVAPTSELREPVPCGRCSRCSKDLFDTCIITVSHNVHDVCSRCFAVTKRFVYEGSPFQDRVVIDPAATAHISTKVNNRE